MLLYHRRCLLMQYMVHTELANPSQWLTATFLIFRFPLSESPLLLQI